MALPESVTQDNFETAGPATRLLIRTRETAAKDRLDAEHVEEFPAHLLSTHALRSLFVDQRDGAVAINRHARKAAVLFPKIGEVRKAQRVEPGRRYGLGQIDAADGDEFLRRREWQRLQEHRVDHAEDGGVRADPEREREHGDDGERGMLDELAQAVADVVHHKILLMGSNRESGERTRPRVLVSAPSPKQSFARGQSSRWRGRHRQHARARALPENGRSRLHSVRKASMGLTRLARRAGIRPAMPAVSASRRQATP